MRVKMCQLSMRKCQTNAQCTAIAGDSCGPASSRMIVAKRTLNSVIQQHSTTVNFGLMTFLQINYYPYYEISAGALSNEVRSVFLDRAELESAAAPCFSEATGPAASCVLNGTTYTKVAANDSRYRLNKGGYFGTVDASWSATCKSVCTLAGVGTGIYLGSHYTFNLPIGTPTTTLKTFTDYAGKTRTSGGKTYYYYEVPTTIRNEGNVFADAAPDVIDSLGIPATCGDDTGAIWNSAMVPFMDTAKDLSPVNAQTMSRKLALLFDKASLGGLMSAGSTPSGCALKNEGAGAVHQRSAYHYLSKVKAENAANGVACRPSHILFLTDGSPNGPGDDDCAHADCALAVPGPGCQCKAVTNARALYTGLGVKVYVVGFSAAVNYGYGQATMNNIAKAGGTEKAFFAVQESELHAKLSEAIYDAVKGNYATSPIASGTPQSSDPTALNTVVLDSRADFPSWKGHLVAFDASTTPPTLLWDTDAGFDPVATPNFWKQRNVFISNGTAENPVKVMVDPATGNITNAAVLRGLGLGATDAEAALIARWMLGDPAMKNPAPMGAIVNSTPTQVGRAPEPSLTYVGASDGMLHAFHARTQTVGGVTYSAGREAFAYIPQDMLPVITRLFAQGGQHADPRRHIYGLANSPKVKRFCTANCTAAASAATWKTVLVMPEGFGGNDVFALDVSAPFGSAGLKTTAADPPIKQLWNTQTSAAGFQGTYEGALGRTISLPGFYFAKSATRDNYRSIFASGYTDLSNSAVGLKIVNASAHTGGDATALSVQGMGLACGKPKVDPTEPTLLADVAIGRRYGALDYERIAAAYVGDTWGNLFRYVPPTDSEGNLAAGAAAVTVVDSFSCSQPLHFPPTVVQLDRHDASKNPGHIYLAQVTNSPMDLNTDKWSTGFPASQLIIRRDLAAAGSAVNPDLTWGDASGRIVLDASNPLQICGVWNNSGAGSCTTPLPTNARPVSSPTGILRADFDGFALVTLWYVPDASGCTKGKTYLTIHEVNTAEGVKQVHGEKVADEPVVGAVFAAGKLVVVLSTGPKPITPSALGQFRVEANRATTTTTMVDRYRRMGWTELP
jgi:hypothetical protein